MYRTSVRELLHELRIRYLNEPITANIDPIGAECLMCKPPRIQVRKPQHTTEEDTPHLILTEFGDDPPAFLDLLHQCAKWVFDNNIKFVDVGAEVILGSG